MTKFLLTLYAFTLICMGVLFAAFVIDKKQNYEEAILNNANDTLCKESIMYYLELYNVPHADIVLKQAILETGS